MESAALTLSEIKPPMIDHSGLEVGATTQRHPPVVSQVELAAILGVHPATVRKMSLDNQLPVRALRIDARPRYSMKTVLRWVLEREPTDEDFSADCRLLPIAEVAKLIGCSRASAYRLFGSDSSPIQPTPVGRERRFPACRVERFIDGE